jgi:hypothetical protein
MVPILKGLFSSFKETCNHQETKKRGKKRREHAVKKEVWLQREAARGEIKN